MAIFGWEGEKELVERPPQARPEDRARRGRRRRAARAPETPGRPADSAPRTCATTCSTPGCWSRRWRRRRRGSSSRRSAAVRDGGDAMRSSRRSARGSRPLLVGCHVSHLYPAGASLYFTVLAPASLRDPLGQWDAAKRAATDAIVGEGATDHPPPRGRRRSCAVARRRDRRAGGRRAARGQERLDPAGILNPGKLLP